MHHISSPQIARLRGLWPALVNAVTESGNGVWVHEIESPGPRPKSPANMADDSEPTSLRECGVRCRLKAIKLLHVGQ
jgi:hypothetical protein